MIAAVLGGSGIIRTPFACISPVNVALADRERPMAMNTRLTYALALAYTTLAGMRRDRNKVRRLLSRGHAALCAWASGSCFINV